MKKASLFSEAFSFLALAYFSSTVSMNFTTAYR